MGNVEVSYGTSRSTSSSNLNRPSQQRRPSANTNRGASSSTINSSPMRRHPTSDSINSSNRRSPNPSRLLREDGGGNVNTTTTTNNTTATTTHSTEDPHLQLQGLSVQLLRELLTDAGVRHDHIIERRELEEEVIKVQKRAEEQANLQAAQEIQNQQDQGEEEQDGMMGMQPPIHPLTEMLPMLFGSHTGMQPQQQNRVQGIRLLPNGALMVVSDRSNSNPQTITRGNSNDPSSQRNRRAPTGNITNSDADPFGGAFDDANDDMMSPNPFMLQTRAQHGQPRVEELFAMLQMLAEASNNGGNLSNLGEGGLGGGTGPDLSSLFGPQGPAPASQQQISQLPTEVIRESDVNANGTNGGGGSSSTAHNTAGDDQPITRTRSNLNCTVCLEDIVPGDTVRTLPCLHRFHTACIDRWLALHNSCPICKTAI